MVDSLRAIFGGLLATASNTGELGTIANWEQHNLPDSIEKPGEELKKMLGASICRSKRSFRAPMKARPGSSSRSVRTSLEAGEA